MRFEPEVTPGIEFAEVREAFLQRPDIAALPPEEQEARWAAAVPNLRAFGAWVTPRAIAPSDLAERLQSIDEFANPPGGMNQG
jgi:hypothetical protein